jgi:hypothetical protein
MHVLRHAAQLDSTGNGKATRNAAHDFIGMFPPSQFSRTPLALRNGLLETHGRGSKPTPQHRKQHEEQD